MNSNSLVAVAAALLLLGAAAGPAQAQPRDSGVGPQIAAQGNTALIAIRAELDHAIQCWRPANSAPPKATAVNDRRRIAGASSADPKAGSGSVL